MGDEDELKLHPAGLDHLRGISQDFHAVPHRGETGGHEPPPSFLLDDADAAGAEGHQPLVVAEGGDPDPRLGRGVHDHRSRGNGDLNAVNGQSRHLFFFSHS